MPILRSDARALRSADLRFPTAHLTLPEQGGSEGNRTVATRRLRPRLSVAPFGTPRVDVVSGSLVNLSLRAASYLHASLAYSFGVCAQARGGRKARSMTQAHWPGPVVAGGGGLCACRIRMLFTKTGRGRRR